MVKPIKKWGIGDWGLGIGIGDGDWGLGIGTWKMQRILFKW